MDKGKNENRCDWGVLKDILGCVAFVVLAVVLIVLVVITCLEWAFDQFGFHFMFWKMVSMLLAFEVFTLPAFMGSYVSFIRKVKKTEVAEEKKEDGEEERCVPFKKAFFRSLAKRYRNDPWMKSLLVDETPETLLGILTGEIISNTAFAFAVFSVKTFMFVYLLSSFGCNYGFWHMFPVVIILSMFFTDRPCTFAAVVYVLSLFGVKPKGNQPTVEGLKTADVTDIIVVDNQFDKKTVEAVDNAVKGEKKTLAEFEPFEQRNEDDGKDS